MSLAKEFHTYSKTKQMVIILLAITLVGALALLPFAFFSLPGVSLGFLLGGLVSIVSYLSIVYGSKTALNSGAKNSAIGFTLLFGFLRFGLYIILLVLAAFCTFRWNFAWLNFWGVFGGLMPMPIAVTITTVRGVNSAKGEKK